MTNTLITGVNRGIGFELARQALDMSWRVIGSTRGDLAGLDAALREHANFVGLSFDVTDDRAVREAATGIDEPIDILINNAGIIGPARQSTLDMDFDGFAETLAINTLAPMRVVQAFLPHLKRSDRPRILTVSSRMGSMSHAKSDRIAYRASKAAVNKVMQGLATDLMQTGVAVVSLHPGWVRTDMGGSAADISPEQSAAGILRVAEQLGMDQTGQFLNWDGAALDW